jgi:hypothetical protein
MAFWTTPAGSITPAEHMRIDSTGKVGIGTDVPGQLLHLYASGVSSTQMVETASVGSDATLSMKTTVNQWDINSKGTTGKFEIFDDGSAARLTIDTTGSIGIGTTEPESYHANADDLVIYQALTPGLTIAGGVDNNGRIFFADGTSSLEPYAGYMDYNHNGDILSFGTAAITRMTIIGNGKVGIGTGFTPEKALHILGSGSLNATLKLEGSTTNAATIEFEMLLLVFWQILKQTTLRIWFLVLMDLQQ